jgi:hypothetical protein
MRPPRPDLSTGGPDPDPGPPLDQVSPYTRSITRRKGQPLSHIDHALAVLGGVLGGGLVALIARHLEHRLLTPRRPA